MRLDTVTEVAAQDVSDVLGLLEAAVAADGHPPLSEQSELALRRGARGTHLLAREDGELHGYGFLDVSHDVAPSDDDGTSGEFVVHPAHRRAGLARAMVHAAEAASPDGRLRLWSHGDHPGAAALAASLGYERVRDLWVMRRSLGEPLPEPAVPEGVRLRPFRPGQDDDAWLAVNARAFAAHPEQGAWTASDLAARFAEPWFDAAGFIVAEDPSSGRMLGSHWTKVHGAVGSPDAMGEVYVVGVDPAAQGRHLGHVLTLAGLHHLRSLGLGSVLLYVESDNEAAVRLYTRLGFEHASSDVMYERTLA